MSAAAMSTTARDRKIARRLIEQMKGGKYSYYNGFKVCKCGIQMLRTKKDGKKTWSCRVCGRSTGRRE